MMRRGLWCGLLVAAVAGGAGPVLGQDMALRIPPPPTVQSLTGAFRVQWQDLPPGAVEQRLMSFAWYYATKADGSDKVRVTTSVRDDFSNFRANWTCPGPFPFDWSLGKHPKKGTWLNGAKGASPLFSNNAIAANSVVSVKVRPALGKQEWGVDLRVQKANQGIQFRADGIRMRILESDNFLDGFNVPTAPAWYWYEFGLQNKKGNDVEIRVRVFNEERTALLASYCKTHRLTKNDLKKGGGITLVPPADFQELYVDPWAACYADDSDNAFTWDTSEVKNGDYFLIAEVAVDGKAPPRTVASSFRVEVRNRN